MATQQRVAIVTGANKGIGLAIVRNLALQYATSSLAPGPFTLYLTARSAERGTTAVNTLLQDPQLKTAKVLVQDGGHTTLSFHELDISHQGSISQFRDYLVKQHPDGVDVVVNNAGVALEGFDRRVVKETLAVNYYGTLEATQAFLPLIKNGGRLVNVSSVSGLLGSYSDSMRKAFHRAAASGGVGAVTSLMEAFEGAVKEGKEKEAGFPSAAYAVSKAGCTAVTKVIAREEGKRGRGVLVNACCPGYVDTDMTKHRGSKTVDQGAETPVFLALGDIGGKAGSFWKEGKEVEW